MGTLVMDYMHFCLLCDAIIMPVRSGGSSGSVEPPSPNSNLARFVELFKSFRPEVKASKSVSPAARLTPVIPTPPQPN